VRLARLIDNGAYIINRAQFQQENNSLELVTIIGVFQAYCVRALGELEAAEAALQSCRREPQGRLRVSVPQIFGRYCVAPLLRELIRKYSGLNIEIAFSNPAVDLFEEGFDLAVRVGSLPNSASLVARKLGVQLFSIVAAHGRPMNVDDSFRL
jgi:DNA-binding transcriptional LysR family regulator